MLATCRKAKAGKILRPRENNGTFLKNGLGCAVGEWQFSGLGSDFERGLKDAAGASGDTMQVGWQKAAWMIFENALFNIFVNKRATQISIVGGLRSCIADRGFSMPIDQGGELSSAEFSDLLKANGIQISMSGKGNWRDNVVLKLLWHNIKNEDVYLKAFDCVSAAKAALANYPQFQSTRWPHQSFGGKTLDMI